MPDLRLSRLTERINPAAAKVAIRAAIFMPLCFLLATLFLGEDAKPFASFGAFILLAMVTFAGRPRPRLVAWIGLVVAGCAFIAVGTLLSQSTVLAALAAGLISFAIFFSGVVNPYFAAARNGAVLLIALPLMIEAPASAVDERLLGWLLACAVCIPATYVVWRLPWYGELRRQAARSARALADLIRDPDSNECREKASKQVWRLRKDFLATPNRPTGATGVSAAIANLVDEQGWTYGLVVNPGAGIASDRQYARDLRSATADLLDSSSDLLMATRGGVSIDETERALNRLVDQNTADLKSQALGDPSDREETITHLEHEFRLRKLAYSVIDVAETAEVASEKAAPPRALGRLWSWVALGRRGMAGAGRIAASHVALDSSWLRNSIRAAIGIALAVLVADLVAVENAFWVVLGTLSVLRSNALGTRGSVKQALLGTLVGIVIGSGVIFLLSDQMHVLWVALPFSVLLAAYAQRANLFAAGQAGFALLVMVLYNLIEPVGWQVGLVRIQDVALGCGVSVVVGFLIWPQGAAPLIRSSLASALEAGANLVRDRARGVLQGVSGNQSDRAWVASIEASELLDATLRRFLDESTGDHVDRESMMAIGSAGLRLRRTAQGIGQIPAQPWYATPGPEQRSEMIDLIDRACDAYLELGRAIADRMPIPETPDLGDPSWLLDSLGGEDDEGFGAGLARIWLYENLQYLMELHQRFRERAVMLFEVSSEDPPPTGDIPRPRASALHRVTAFQSG